MGESRQSMTFLLFLTLGGLASASIGRFLPFSGFIPIPSKTPQPINIDTSDTYPLVTLQPLTFAGNEGQEPAILKNTGGEVGVTLEHNYTTNIIMGGPLGNSIYTFIRTAFRWTNNTNGIAYSSVDGQGSPLEVILVYYNLKYKSYFEALNYRDGLCKYSIRMHIGKKPNPAFKPFAKAMKAIRNPNTSVSINLYDAFSWYYNFPDSTKYYVYAGSQNNGTQDKEYYCTTTIVSEHEDSQYLSKKQFINTFVKTLNNKHNRLITLTSQYPQGKRIVAQGEGIRKKPTFNNIYPSILGSM